jgi:hypothetical protein
MDADADHRPQLTTNHERTPRECTAYNLDLSAPGLSKVWSGKTVLQG